MTVKKDTSPGNTTLMRRFLDTLSREYSKIRVLPTTKDVQSRGILWILCALLTVSLIFTLKNPKTVVETKTVEVIKVVEKEVVKEKVVTQYKTRTVSITKPDGTNIHVEEKSGEKVADIERMAERIVEAERETVTRAVIVSKPDYAVSGGIIVDRHLERTYYLEGAIRLADSPVFLTTIVTTQPLFGIGVRVEF
jgi:hypothetical protein